MSARTAVIGFANCVSIWGQALSSHYDKTSYPEHGPPKEEILRSNSIRQSVRYSWYRHQLQDPGALVIRDICYEVIFTAVTELRTSRDDPEV